MSLDTDLWRWNSKSAVVGNEKLKISTPAVGSFLAPPSIMNNTRMLFQGEGRPEKNHDTHCCFEGGLGKRISKVFRQMALARTVKANSAALPFQSVLEVSEI